MKTASIALMVCIAGTAAGQPEPKLTVYVRNTALVPGPVLIPAEGLAGKMFAKIGIALEWRNGKPAAASSEAPIFVELVTDTPDSRRPGALAFALPYEGSHLTIFYDRVREMPYSYTVLAHVLVHEITHLLQGFERHSDTGVMMAHWSVTDYGAMRSKPFPFTPWDVHLIYDGLAQRQGASAVAAVDSTR